MTRSLKESEGIKWMLQDMARDVGRAQSQISTLLQAFKSNDFLENAMYDDVELHRALGVVRDKYAAFTNSVLELTTPLSSSLDEFEIVNVLNQAINQAQNKRE